jgi:hypothetical protein
MSWCRAGAILAALLLSSSTAAAQAVTEPSLKAAFIYNFAKFTEWPPGVLSASTPFVACVLGDATVGDALERAVHGRLLWGRAITVSRLQLEGNTRPCHLLYVAGVSAAQTEQVLVSVRGAPVLTISEADDYGPLGSIARLFVENGRLRFALSLDLAKRSRLQLSSKLIILATRIEDQASLGGR